MDSYGVWGTRENYRRAYALANRQRFVANAKRWKAANRDRENRQERARRAANSEKYRAAERRKRHAKPHIYRAKRNARDRRLREAAPPWVDRAELKRIYELAAWLGMQVDHIYPLKGANFCGLHVPWNLQLLTATENAAKGNRLPVA